MLIPTAAERQYAIDELKIAADAPDEVVRKSICDALSSDVLDLDKWRELIAPEAGSLAALLQEADDGFRKASSDVRDEILVIARNKSLSWADRSLQIKGLKKDIRIDMAATAAAQQEKPNMPDPIVKNAEMPNQKNGTVVVKKASDQYRHTKSVAKHAKTGEVMTTDRGRQAETPSERDYAKTGVLFKYFCGRRGIAAPLSEHENELLQEIFNEDTWSGAPAGEKSYETGMSGLRCKQLIADTTSGGIYATPEWFDEQVVQYPLLNGELFPYVTVREVPRGATVETVSVGNPTVQWGTTEGTPMSLFDPSDLINEIEKSIFPVTCVVEVGRDLMNDSVVSIGQVLENNIGQRFTAEFDDVIANGNGTSQPEGIFTASGISSVNNAGGAGTAATLADYENLYFGIGKQYRNPAMRCAFVANDVTYKRLRSIPVDASTDQRRLMGSNYADYSMMGAPFRIQNDVGNANRAFGALATYRIWRRQSIEIQQINGTDLDLARRNMIAIVFRARMGGGIVDPNAWIKTTDGQA